VCIKGLKFDGHSIADEMLEKGAAAVVTERDLGLENQIVVENTRKAYPYICANYFDRPDLKLKIIGVTGTNGKTTITTVTKQILTSLGYKTGLIGTSHNEIGDEILHTERTTPEPYDLFELLKKMADSGCEYSVMEVSSQALEQLRTGPIHFSSAVFTNLTQDHLDVHGTMANYYQAKKKIFDVCDFAVINADDEAGRRYYSEIKCTKYSYSVQGFADYYADCIKLSAKGSSFWFSDGVKTYPVQFLMPGLFNVSNLTAVIACLARMGFNAERVIEAAALCTGVKGRAEVIPTKRDFTVICDYAHTPDALENILPNVRNYTQERLICLFGCGGNRDAAKRPLMAAAAAKHSDLMIVTSDNPRDEDPNEIIKAIIGGLDGSDTEYITITDRKEAIFYALKIAKKGDVIVLCGKGHEDYQILKNNVKIHFDEREIVAEGLKKLD
jgi:UDP-N-acetylmuramoyl-L-alanyl-D-glutamate--2,6-diaminopimelate ligase